MSLLPVKCLKTSTHTHTTAHTLRLSHHPNPLQNSMLCLLSPVPMSHQHAATIPQLLLLVTATHHPVMVYLIQDYWVQHPQTQMDRHPLLHPSLVQDYSAQFHVHQVSMSQTLVIGLCFWLRICMAWWANQHTRWGPLRHPLPLAIGADLYQQWMILLRHCIQHSLLLVSSSNSSSNSGNNNRKGRSGLMTCMWWWMGSRGQAPG